MLIPFPKAAKTFSLQQESATESLDIQGHVQSMIGLGVPSHITQISELAIVSTCMSRKVLKYNFICGNNGLKC